MGSASEYSLAITLEPWRTMRMVGLEMFVQAVVDYRAI